MIRVSVLCRLPRSWFRTTETGIGCPGYGSISACISTQIVSHAAMVCLICPIGMFGLQYCISQRLKLISHTLLISMLLSSYSSPANDSFISPMQQHLRGKCSEDSPLRRRSEVVAAAPQASFHLPPAAYRKTLDSSVSAPRHLVYWFAT